MSEGRGATVVGVVSQLPHPPTGIHANVGLGSTPLLHAFVSGGVVADLAYPSYCGVWLLFHAFEKEKNHPRADDDQNNPTAARRQRQRRQRRDVDA